MVRNPTRLLQDPCKIAVGNTPGKQYINVKMQCSSQSASIINFPMRVEYETAPIMYKNEEIRLNSLFLLGIWLRLGRYQFKCRRKRVNERFF